MYVNIRVKIKGHKNLKTYFAKRFVLCLASRNWPSNLLGECGFDKCDNHDNERIVWSLIIFCLVAPELKILEKTHLRTALIFTVFLLNDTVCTLSIPFNLLLVKYWGKFPEKEDCIKFSKGISIQLP